MKDSGGINAAILDARIQELEGTLLAHLDQISVVGTRDCNEPHEVVVSKNVPYKLKPFCLLQGKDFHNKSIKLELATKWKPIFRLMEQCPVFEIPGQVKESFVLSSFCRPLSF